MVALPLVSTVPLTSVGGNRAKASLTEAATAGGRFFGAAARFDQIAAESELRDALLRDCSSLTPEIHLKWDALEWEQGRFNFKPADDLVAFAIRNGLDVRGHTLLWDQSTPSWAKRQLASKRDWDLIARFFGSVVPRYADRIAQWDVVNEPIDTENGRDGLRRNCFHRAFGPQYIERALEETRSHAPRARLMINDYGFDYDNPVDEARRDSFLRLAERLKRQGTPFDGVGIQAHLDLSKGPIEPAVVGTFLRRLGQLGLDIVITELDVKEADLSAPVAVRDARVAAEVETYLAIALAEPNVKGVVTWGLSDRHSWLQDQLPEKPNLSDPVGLNRGLPYDAALDPKPMYWALREALLQPA